MGFIKRWWREPSKLLTHEGDSMLKLRKEELEVALHVKEKKEKIWVL